MTARLMLERKGIDYRRVDLMPVISKVALRGLRFPGVTVPALRIDGRRIQGSREIARELDRLVPEPPLYPADPERRAAVEEAERFGDEELQAPARRIVWNALHRDRSPLRSFAPTSRRCRGCSTESTAGSPTASSVAPSRMPPTSRSRPACGC